MSGKEKCNFLRSLRVKIAEENHIEYVDTPCSFKGECQGTCPKCDKELLELTQKVGKLGIGVTAAVGVSLLSLGLNGCTPDDGKSASNQIEVLSGDVIVAESEISCSEDSQEPFLTQEEAEDSPLPLMGVAVIE